MADGSLRQPLVWVDLEMTGLDPERDRIVEIAVIVTDGELERVEEGPDLVIHQPADVLAAMDEVVVKMHAESGLTAAVGEAALDVATAEAEALEFVTKWIPEPRSAPLAGNSVHADRAFLRRYMPRLEAHLHYRNVDVSTLKELARRWSPDVLAEAPVKAGGHRALADIRESIAELRWYREKLFVRSQAAPG
jgi:oligoribonuclease